MKLIIELDPTNKSEVADAQAILSVAVNSDVTASVAKTEAKAEKPAAPKAKAPVKKAPVKTEDEDDDESDAAEVTLDDVREKAKELINGGNREAVKEILEELGVASVTKLTTEQYAEFIEAANNL